MIRGWRNDPRWVEHYRKRDQERAQREIDRMRIEYEMAQNAAYLERAIENMKRKPLNRAWESW